jgi:hypothetical protein
MTQAPVLLAPGVGHPPASGDVPISITDEGDDVCYLTDADDSMSTEGLVIPMGTIIEIPSLWECGTTPQSSNAISAEDFLGQLSERLCETGSDPDCVPQTVEDAVVGAEVDWNSTGDTLSLYIDISPLLDTFGLDETCAVEPTLDFTRVANTCE